MPDDVDDLLRRAMKTLDDQVPSGYFEGLPSRTLARLEGQMQQSSGTDSEKASSTASITSSGPKEEDSGLHDIRSLASSTKARLSSRRSSQNPIVPDDDILASSSAGWKAVALPEPAKMISLPELAELPSKKELKAQRKSENKLEAPVATPVADAAPTVTPIASRVAKPTKKSKAPSITLAIVGIGVAAAAGAVIFVATTSGSKKEAGESLALAPSAHGEREEAKAPPAKPTVEPIRPADPTPAMIASAGSAAAPEDAATVETKAVDTPKPQPPAVSTKSGKHKVTVGKAVPEVSKTTDKATKDEPITKKGPDKPEKPEKGDKGKGSDGEPSFDDLLKEAGVNQQQKVDTKPKLAKKSLSGDDIKHGMSSVAAKAQACYAGQQGTAAVKLTVTPEGKVEKVKVTGQFAGTPVGACVEAAVKGASFPPWDGGPQSFGYSYLLSE